ncbi:MAG: iron-sulfur cluster assembly scaffold protein [Rhizobiales bacterium]|nr:iron-sulfur cluster assembly scaffold protein [Hyphomicrobiales bacterium]
MDAPEDIYSTKILEVVAAMPQLGCFEGADGSASKSSKLCGSKIEVCLNVEDGKISKYGQTVEACLLGQAAASVMAQNAIGLTKEEIVSIRDDMLAMLKEDGPAPNGIWADLEVLYPVKDYKPRHTSMMLVFEATIAALDEAGKS